MENSHEGNTVIILQSDIKKVQYEPIKKRLKLPDSLDAVNLLVKMVTSMGDKIDLFMNFRSYNLLDALLSEESRELTEKIKIKFLKQLFTDFVQNGLYGRAKEKGKYILLFDLTPIDKGILLLQTLDAGPELKIKENGVLEFEERFLDRHNIYRFVYFIKADSKITVRYFEKTPSEHFQKWLGIEREPPLYHIEDFTVSFYCEYSGIPLKVSIGEGELNRGELSEDGKFLKIKDEVELDIYNNKLNLTASNNRKVPLKIRRIYVNIVGESFTNLLDFIKYIKLRQHGLDYLRSIHTNIIRYHLNGNTRQAVLYPLYKERYEDIVPLDSKNSLFDRVNKYEFISDKFRDKILIMSDLKVVEYDIEFLKLIAEKIINSETVEIIHSLLPLSETPRHFGKLWVYNEINLPQPAVVLDDIFQNEPLDRTWEEILKWAIISTLQEIPKFKFFISSLLSSQIFDSLGYKIDGKAIKLENDIVEYKRPDILYGEKGSVIKSLKQHVEGKVFGGKSPIKLFIIGIDENTREIYVINRGRAGDDFKQDIFNELKRYFSEKGVKLSEPISLPAKGYIVKGPYKEPGDGHILAFYTVREDIKNESR